MISRKFLLSDVCTLRNGRAYKKEELLAAGKYTVLRVGNFFTNKNWYHSDLELDDTKYCNKGDLLYAWSASFGPRIWEGEKVIYHYHIWRVDIDYELIDKKFLFYWFEFDKEQIKKESGTGTTMMHVSKTSMEKRELWLPPIAEQERIVAKLDAAFAGIDEAVNAFESKESEVQALKTSILNKLLNSKSNGWESSYLEGVSSFISRGISPKYIESGGVRVLNQKCIRNHHINYDLARRHDIDLKKVSEERFIRLGDILINSTGQGTLGRVAQVRKEPDELTTIDSHITIVRPKSELFYLDYFGYAAIAIEKIIQDAGQGTSGQTELAKSKVQNDFQICFPRSFSEQEAEVKKLDIVFKETEIALKNLIKSKTNLYALKSAILSQELQPSEAA